MFDTKIPLYGAFIVISVFSGLFTFYKNINEDNINSIEKYSLVMYFFIGITVGAKCFGYLINGSDSLSFYGAIIGIIIMLLLFSFIYKKSFMNLLYAFFPCVPLMYGIGKIGCFFIGCCYGIRYKGIFHVVYNYSYSAPKGVSLFPIQLLESIVFILIFIFFSMLIRKNGFRDIVLGWLFIVCGVFKFFLDYLRMSHVGIILSFNQVISLFFCLVGLFLLVKKHILR